MSAPTTTFTPRGVAKIVKSIEQGEGYGARVKRSIGRPELRNVDPFLMLDEFSFTGKEGDSPIGFPDHPHRGFETVSYLLPSSEAPFYHEDFMGNKGTLKPGSLQWMTAGRGVMHSEMPAQRGKVHGLQLWVNLAAKDKMVEPAYQELAAEDIKEVERDGVKVRVIAGEALGAKSQVYTRTPTHYLHFTLAPGARLEQPVPEGWASFAYIISGNARFTSGGADEAKSFVGASHTVQFTAAAGQTGVVVVAGDKGAEFVLLSGKPIGEPIVQHGPFVMNTREEIMEAMRDYQLGRNGFEGAAGWQSEVGKPITDFYH